MKWNYKNRSKIQRAKTAHKVTKEEEPLIMACTMREKIMNNFSVISITNEKEVLKYIIKDFLSYSEYENRNEESNFYKKLLDNFNSIEV